MRAAIAACALAACVPAPRAPAIDPATCAATLRARYAIDTAPAPAICVPLAAALAPLGPAAIARIRGLAIVRGGRGRCGDACPDLATALMSASSTADARHGPRRRSVLRSVWWNSASRPFIWSTVSWS